MGAPVVAPDRQIDGGAVLGIVVDALVRDAEGGRGGERFAGAEGPDIAWFKDPAGNILSVLQAADD